MVYKYIAGLYPQKIKRSYDNLIATSQLNVESNRFLGFIILFGLLLSLTISVYSLMIFKVSFFYTFLASFFGIEAIIFALLWLSADKKAKFVDKVLPDALQIMSGNLRSGLTTDKAIISAARPEFGPLKQELDKVSRKIALGTDISISLKGMLIGINSQRLRRTISIINNGLKSGGNLAPLLEQTAEDIRKQDIIDSKIKASVGMYTILIFVAVAVASPVLFGFSTVLVKVLTKILSSIDIPSGSTGSIPLSIGTVNIKEDFLLLFITVFLISNSFFGSLLLGMISKGKAKRGLVYLPVFLILAFTVFYLSKNFLEGILGGLFGL